MPPLPWPAQSGRSRPLGRCAVIFEAEGVVFLVLFAFWIWALLDVIATDAERVPQPAQRGLADPGPDPRRHRLAGLDAARAARNGPLAPRLDRLLRAPPADRVRGPAALQPDARDHRPALAKSSTAASTPGRPNSGRRKPSSTGARPSCASVSSPARTRARAATSDGQPTRSPDGVSAAGRPDQAAGPAPGAAPRSGSRAARAAAARARRASARTAPRAAATRRRRSRRAWRRCR